jgi:hypothetical protein
MRASLSPRVFILFLLAVGLIGCGAGARRPITGTVTFRGQPLDHGRIQFFTTTKRPIAVGGAMIENGKYTLPGDFGLDPGTYRIQLDSMEPDPTYKPKPGEMLSVPPTRNRLPDRYGAGSTITVQVTPGGPNQFDFNIEEK